MKKILFFMSCVLLFLIFNIRNIKANNLTNKIYKVESGDTFNVSNEQVEINPSNNHIYSFDYKNNASDNKFNRGNYIISFTGEFSNKFDYRKILVITDSGFQEIVLSNAVTVNSFFYSEIEFYLRFEFKTKAGDKKIDKIKGINLIVNDNRELISLNKKVMQEHIVNNEIPLISFKPDNSDFSFSIGNKTIDNKFPIGIYQIGFQINLPSCYEQLQLKIKLISNNFTKEILAPISGNTYYTYNLFNEESFYIVLDGKVSNNTCGNEKITFKNILLNNLSHNNIFLRKELSGMMYTIDNFEKKVVMEPLASSKSYMFEIFNGINNKLYEPGDYELSFNYDLNACGNNCNNYNYQHITIKTINEEETYPVSYVGKGNFSFEFSVLQPFSLIIENNLNNVRNDTYPLDSFSNFILTKDVGDLIPPQFENSSGVYIVNIDNPTSVEQIKNTLTAFDETDGDLTSYIIIEKDNYTPNKDKIGIYDVTFSVSDFSNNKTTIIILVSVVDVTPPTISGPNEIQCSIANGCLLQDEQLTISNLISILTISDNVDNNLNYFILEDTWSDIDHNIFDSYQVILYAKDSSNNKSNNFTINITYLDDIKPNLIQGETIYTSNSKHLTLLEITNNIIISNNFNGDKTISENIASEYFTLMSNEYINNESIIGIYEIVFEYEEINFTINIEVIDDIPPVFYLDNNIFHVDTYLNLTHEQIITLLLNLNYVNYNPLNVDFILDEYTANQAFEGEYKLILNFQYEQNRSEIIELTIITHHEEKSDSQSLENKKKTFFQKIWLFIKNIFSKINNLFKTIFNFKRK